MYCSSAVWILGAALRFSGRFSLKVPAPHLQDAPLWDTCQMRSQLPPRLLSKMLATALSVGSQRLWSSSKERSVSSTGAHLRTRISEVEEEAEYS